MCLRHTIAATIGALALVVTLPTSASAATGDFSYTYFDNGTPQTATLHDPESAACITLLEVADEDTSEAAFAPHNDTDTLAMVFTEPDCTGDSWTLRPTETPQRTASSSARCT